MTIEQLIVQGFGFGFVFSIVLYFTASVPSMISYFLKIR
jgi:hypothetical protein